MKVCLVNSFYPPWIGGAETYVSNLARGLEGRGDRVTVYCASNPLAPGETFEDGVRVRRMRAPLRLYGTPIAVSPLNLFREDYDVIHCNFPSPYLSALFSWFGKLRGIPTVLTWHNDLPKVTSAAGLLVTAHNLLSPCYLNYYGRIIATTEVYAKTSYILRQYSRKVRVVPNGVDTRRFSPEVDGGAVRGHPSLEGTTVVLFVGALTQWHAYKGLDSLLKAFKLAARGRDHLRLVIVGSGPLLPMYGRMIVEMGLGSSAILVGRANDTILPQYYAACDMAVLPSRDRSEGFGLVLLEAMASGKPVIGTDAGGVAEVIHDGESGILVKPGDSESLADAIGRLADDPGLRSRMGFRGRAFAEQHTWSKTVELTRQVYQEAGRG